MLYGSSRLGIDKACREGRDEKECGENLHFLVDCKENGRVNDS